MTNNVFPRFFVDIHRILKAKRQRNAHDRLYCLRSHIPLTHNGLMHNFVYMQRARFVELRLVPFLFGKQKIPVKSRTHKF